MKFTQFVLPFVLQIMSDCSCCFYIMNNNFHVTESVCVGGRAVGKGGGGRDPAWKIDPTVQQKYFVEEEIGFKITILQTELDKIRHHLKKKKIRGGGEGCGGRLIVNK